MFSFLSESKTNSAQHFSCIAQYLLLVFTVLEPIKKSSGIQKRADLKTIETTVVRKFNQIGKDVQ